MPRPTKNLTGMKFGKLTVLYKHENKGASRWECVCECGQTKKIHAVHLLSGRIKSCGCLQIEYNNNKHKKLIGKKFGNLLVLSIEDRKGSRKQIRYRCVCDCGKKVIVFKERLLSGKTKSCGCLLKKIFHEKAKDFSNKKFGKITVIKLSEERGNRNQRKWDCICDCGNKITMSYSSLKEGKNVSCGCIRNKPINMPKEKLFLGKHLHGICGYARGCRCTICKSKQSEYNRNRRNNNLSVKILTSLRGSFYKSLKRQNVKKNDHVASLISCDIKFLIRHLEKQFKDGMNWENYGKVWQVDHIIPCAYFDFSNKDERWQCFHFNNLQPCFSRENMSKNSIYNGRRQYHKKGLQNGSV